MANNTYGDITGKTITLGNDDDTVTVNGTAYKSTINTGAGDDTITAQCASDNPALALSTINTGVGNDTVEITGGNDAAAVVGSTINLGDGANELNISGSQAALAGLAAFEQATLGKDPAKNLSAKKAVVSAGKGNDAITIESTGTDSYAMNFATLTDTGGNNTVVIKGGEIRDSSITLNGNNTLVIGGDISAKYLSTTVTTGSGSDAVYLRGGVELESPINAKIAASVALGAGNDTFCRVIDNVPEDSMTFAAKTKLDGGAGVDTLRVARLNDYSDEQYALSLSQLFADGAVIKGMEILDLSNAISDAEDSALITTTFESLLDANGVKLTLNAADIARFTGMQTLEVPKGHALKNQAILRIKGGNNDTLELDGGVKLDGGPYIIDNVQYNLWLCGDDKTRVLVQTGVTVDGDDVYQRAVLYGDAAKTITISDPGAEAAKYVFGKGNDKITVNGAISKVGIGAGDGANTVTVNGDMTDNSIITGGSGVDTVTVNGAVNNSTINTGAGNDKLYLNGQVLNGGTVAMGSGNDVVYVTRGGAGPAVAAAGTLDGGEGKDTLQLSGMGANFTLADIATGTGSVKNFEVFDLSGTAANTLSIKAADLAAFDAPLEAAKFAKNTNAELKTALTGADVLRIHGDNKDAVNFDILESWTRMDAANGKALTVTYDGIAYNLYQSGDKSVLVKTGVPVSLGTPHSQITLAGDIHSGLEIILPNVESQAITIVNGTTVNGIAIEALSGVAFDSGALSSGVFKVTDIYNLPPSQIIAYKVAGSDTVYTAQLVSKAVNDDGTTVNLDSFAYDAWYVANGDSKYTVTTKGHSCTVIEGEMQSGSKFTGGAGDDVVTVASVTGGTINAGNGANTVEIGDMQAAMNGKNVLQSKLTTGTGNDDVTLTGTIKDGSSIDTGAGNDTVTITGTMQDKSVLSTGAGDDIVDLQGTITGTALINLGAGNDEVRIPANAATMFGNAVIEGGAGIDTVTVYDNLDGIEGPNPEVKWNFKGIEILHTAVGQGTHKLSAADHAFDTASMTALSGLTGNNAALNGQKILRMTFDEPDKVEFVEPGWYLAKGNITIDGVTYDLWKSPENGGNQVLIQQGAVPDADNLPGDGAQYVNDAAAAKADTLDLTPAQLTSAVRVNLGEGNNTFTANGDIKANSVVSTGAGKDTITVTGDVAGNTMIDAGNGTNTVTVGTAGGNNTFSGIIRTGTGNDTVTVNSDVSDGGMVVTGAGNDVLRLNGTVENGGKVDMGAGNDIVHIGQLADTDSSVVAGGLLDGGDGKDTLNLANMGATITLKDIATEPNAVTGFEILDMRGGYANAMYINAADMAAFATDNGQPMRILGDAGAGKDMVNFNVLDGWQKGATQTIEGTNYTKFTAADNTVVFVQTSLVAANVNLGAVDTELRLSSTANSYNGLTVSANLADSETITILNGEDGMPPALNPSFGSVSVANGVLIFTAAAGFTSNAQLPVIAYTIGNDPTIHTARIVCGPNVGASTTVNLDNLADGAWYEANGDSKYVITTKGDSHVDINGDMLTGSKYTGGAGIDSLNVETFRGTINAGDGNNSITITNSMSGTLKTGAGNDVVSIAAKDALFDGNIVAMDKGDINLGGGNDTLTITGKALASTINTGAGNDTVYIQRFLQNEGEGLHDNSTLNTGDGDDVVWMMRSTINGKSTVNLGAGDDALHFVRGFDGVRLLDAATNFNGKGATLDGGAGTDTLYLHNEQSYKFNLDSLVQGSAATIKGVEIVNIADDSVTGITFSVADVARFTNTSDGQPLRIQGDAGDTVTLLEGGGGWHPAGRSEIIDNVHYTLWQCLDTDAKPKPVMVKVWLQDGLVVLHDGASGQPPLPFVTPYADSLPPDARNAEDGSLYAITGHAADDNPSYILSDHDDTLLFYSGEYRGFNLNLGGGNDIVNAQGEWEPVGTITGGAGNDHLFGLVGLASDSTIDLNTGDDANDRDILSINEVENYAIDGTILKGTNDSVNINGKFNGTLTEIDDGGENFSFTEMTGMDSGTVTLFGGLRIDQDFGALNGNSTINMVGTDAEHSNEVWLGGWNGNGWGESYSSVIDATGNTAGTAQLHLVVDRAENNYEPDYDNNPFNGNNGDVFAGLFDENGTAMARGIDTLYLNLDGGNLDTLDLSGDGEGSLESLFKVGSNDGQSAGEVDIRIVGDLGDTVKLDADYTKGVASTLDDGITYDVWSNEDYTVYIQQQLQVETGV
jgi:hypothetical protein